MEMPEISLDAPIPGQSLTAPLGDRPWQNPAQYATPEEALEFYIPKILDPIYSDQILDVLETGMPITVIANALQSVMVMEGKHTIDVGILVAPVLIELIELIAENAGIKYVKGTDAPEGDKEKISEAKISKVIAKLKSAEGEKAVTQEEPVVDKEQDEPTGLMARRT